MAKRFRTADRDQPFLLPVDLREWLPAGHEVWLIIDAVEQLDLSRFLLGYRLGGAGRRAYDPAMMLALLIYGYATGIRSSRAIERACHTDVAFRVICANDPPDHTQIARFRQQYLATFEDLFTQILIMCARLGYARLGIVAIDGTKIAANASIDANHERDYYAGKVTAMTSEAAHTDTTEDAQHGPDRRGDEPPPGLSGRGAAGQAERTRRLRQCLDELNAEQTSRDQHNQAQQDKIEQYLTRARTETVPGRPPAGTPKAALLQAKQDRLTARHGPDHPETRHAAHAAHAAHAETDTRTGAATQDGTPAETPAEGGTPTQDGPAKPRKPCSHGARCHRPGCRPAPPQRNSTDPDSRLMPTRRGFVQGYNAQLTATADHFILTADLVQDTGDTAQLQPMMAAAETTAALLRPHRPDPDTPDSRIGTILADNGYCSAANLTLPGPDRLIATGKTRTLTAAPATTGPPPHDATPVQAMHHRLRTPDGAALYKKRGATIEPINGNLKDRGQLRQFLLRGLEACKAELHLAALAHNLRHLHNLQTA